MVKPRVKFLALGYSFQGFNMLGVIEDLLFNPLLKILPLYPCHFDLRGATLSMFLRFTRQRGSDG